jgi:hypothetical protein
VERGSPASIPPPMQSRPPRRMQKGPA